MISGSVVVPFQKGPCGEGGRVRGFLLPLLVEVSVLVVLLLISFSLYFLDLDKQNLEEEKEEKEVICLLHCYKI